MDAQRPKIAYITGTSRGIGKALALKLLSEDYWVIGLSRSASINHPHFQHITLDLSDLKAVRTFEFTEKSHHVILVNNAGMIGEIGPIGAIDDSTFEEVINVNTIAPQLLTNRFISTYRSHVKFGHILNISSGAGKNPIDGWATYCASKAAIDLFSKTIDLEFKLHTLQNWCIHSIAPGVVDTEMQAQIRSAKSSEFKSIDRFIALKNDGQLSTAETVALQLFRVIEQPHQFESTVISVRDFE